MNTSDPSEHPPGPRSRFYFQFICVVIGLNLLALLVAWRDRSWIAMGVAVIWGPALNASLFLGALLAIRRAKQHLGFSLGKHLLISLAVAAVAVLLDYVIIMSMHLHGC